MADFSNRWLPANLIPLYDYKITLAMSSSCQLHLEVKICLSETIAVIFYFLLSPFKLLENPTICLFLFLNLHLFIPGISWTLLHEMDYQKYISVRHDYILLPEHALTNTTRLRWWQPFTISNGIVVSGPDRAQWALDNILIGGAEINPSQLVDTFDDGKTGCES